MGRGEMESQLSSEKYNMTTQRSIMVGLVLDHMLTLGMRRPREVL